MNKQRKKHIKPNNFLLSIMNTWQKFNEDIPEKIHLTRTKEKLKKEREKKIGPRVSNKKSYFSQKEIEIIQELAANPRKSYVEIANFLGLSRHTVKKKIEEMLDNSKIKIFLGVNHKKLTLNLILFNLIVKNLKNLDEIFLELQNCPRVFSITKDIAKNSLTILLGIEKSITEENNQMVCMLERFQLDERVKESSVLSLYPEIFPNYLMFQALNSQKSHFENNCNSNCEICDFFVSNRCPGCPITKIFSEKFFKII
ncbi:MAG: winged helix-turn-helix transcriptional regulator [Candidatus Lokiarchaeota archaeon]|nr:winged helix-turn-helix transcriptional regulator [Candidatus Lokiarchaeota archaeon]